MRKADFLGKNGRKLSEIKEKENCLKFCTVIKNPTNFSSINSKYD
jgi:hypothetical protein